MWRSVDVFANRHYRLLWVSSLFSFTGMQMQHVARALLAWDLTHSFGAIGAISLSFGLPMLLFSLVGGSLADRFEKRNLSLLTQALTAAVALVNAVLVGTDVITFEMLFLLGLILGTFSALGMPARTPLMAEVVGQDHMMGAIAMSNAAMNGTRLFGPAVAGVMAGFWGIESAYFAMAGLYAISCLTLLQVPTGLGAARRAGAAARRPGGGMLGEISNGLRYVATDPRLRLLNLMMIIITIFAMPYTLLLAGFVQKDLGRGSEAFGFMQSFSGAGALVGSIGVAFLTRV
jgi:MFS family permease